MPHSLLSPFRPKVFFNKLFKGEPQQFLLPCFSVIPDIFLFSCNIQSLRCQRKLLLLYYINVETEVCPVPGRHTLIPSDYCKILKSSARACADLIPPS